MTLTHSQPFPSGLSRPVSRRNMLGLIGVTAAAALVARRALPGDSESDAASAGPSGPQPPPAYDGIVGLL